MPNITTSRSADDRQSPLYRAVSDAYDRWQSTPLPASHVLEGRIARGRVWLGQRGPEDPGYAEAQELLEQLRRQLAEARWAEGVEGTAEWCVVAQWEAARVEFETAESAYLHWVGGHKVGEGSAA